MRKEAILAIVIAGVLYITGAVYFMTRPAKKVTSFKEVMTRPAKKVTSFKEVTTQTLEEVQIKKISDYLPVGLYEVKVNDSLTVLVYSESHGNSMIRIK
jgi:hypothetical protein